MAKEVILVQWLNPDGGSIGPIAYYPSNPWPYKDPTGTGNPTKNALEYCRKMGREEGVGNVWIEAQGKPAHKTTT